MRITTTAPARFVLAIAVLLAAAVAPVRGEDSSSHIMRYEKAEFDGIDFKGESQFEISAPEQLPKQLVWELEHSGCRYKEIIKSIPAQFIAFERQRFALLPCPGMTRVWHHVYDLSNVRRPRLVHLPVIAPDTGMTSTSAPGFITWQKGTPYFHSETSTDMCPCPMLRHVYRIGENPGEGIGLVLIRVELQKERPEGEWRTIWDSPKWPTKDDFR
ncbi:hypothetical protein [Bradyrhizobium sp. SZCCHNS2096]|uniref:hypothetical protein n=1 Tax=Bradyrhizobium sp. SZCCHNS2096 TaxID=3057309 RepID=UPI00291641D6|nr:hypothetical protein [Bradyrhizobium sp. SZCCHNS2096]